jgi:predicted ATPase
MGLISKIEEKETINQIYSLLQNGERKSEIEDQRVESLKHLEKATDLCLEIKEEKGKDYLSKNYPDILPRMNILMDKLINYNS